MKVDRASMACGLEVRAPFLDVELVEFLSRVPARLKLRRFETKHLLKRAMARIAAAGDRGPRQEGIRDPGRGLVEDGATRAAAGRAVAGTAEAQGIFDPVEVTGSCRSISPAGATTASSCGRSSSSSSGTGAGSRSGRDDRRGARATPTPHARPA